MSRPRRDGYLFWAGPQPLPCFRSLGPGNFHPTHHQHGMVVYARRAPRYGLARNGPRSRLPAHQGPTRPQTQRGRPHQSRLIPRTGDRCVPDHRHRTGSQPPHALSSAGPAAKGFPSRRTCTYAGFPLHPHVHANVFRRRALLFCR